MLVKMIVKCHKKASKSTKVSSLYLFDAVARHARDVVRKKGQGFDPSGARAPKNDSTIEPGTTEALVAGAKAFLSTAQLAAQELCIDTMATVSQEQKVRSSPSSHALLYTRIGGMTLSRSLLPMISCTFRSAMQSRLALLCLLTVLLIRVFLSLCRKRLKR